jgi:hypothetical protein
MTQERIVVLADKETKEEIQRLAEEEGRTMSKYFLNCHKEHVKKKEESIPYITTRDIKFGDY